MIGKIVVWRSDKGYGWLQCENGREVFAHVSQFAGQPKPREWLAPIGQRVNFDIGMDTRSDRSAARNIVELPG